MSQPVVRQPIPVGKFFLDRGLITAQQLELALKHRDEFGLKLGQSLVELGLVTEADMVDALSHQARFPCIRLSGGIVDARIAAKVGETVSRRLKAVALNQIAGHTTVALEDPSNEEALEELAHILATRIFPVYAEPTAIQKSLERVFGAPRRRKAQPQPASASSSEQAVQRAKPQGSPPVLPTQQSAAPGTAPAVPAAQPGPDERAVVERVRAFLHQAFEQGVSDIHLEPRRAELLVRFRLEGVLREHSRMPLPWARPMMACLKALAKVEDTKGPSREGVIPFLFNKRHLEVRVSFSPSLHGDSAVLHVVVCDGAAGQLREVAQLGLLEPQRAALDSILMRADGLTLVTGPSKSGLRTTLFALLRRLATPEKKAISFGTELRHELENVLHVQAEPSAGFDCATGTRSLLRLDPDLMLVHESEGEEAVKSLVDATLSGCRVLAGIRSTGALALIGRLTSLGIEPFVLSDALTGIVGQRLVRRICKDCRAPMVPEPAIRARLGLGEAEGEYFEGKGCPACHGTGYAGRLALFEILAMTPGLRQQIERGADSATLRRAAQEEGFLALREHGLYMARAGLTTLRELLAVTSGT